MAGTKGFSLIELLAATVILIGIVLIMSNIFHQSSVAWDAGLRRTDGGLMARSVLSLIAKDISTAVAPTNYLAISYPSITYDVPEIQDGDDKITLVTLNENPSNAFERAALKVCYECTGSTLTRESWHMAFNGSEGYGHWESDAGGRTPLATNVVGLVFRTPSHEYFGTLPPWIKVQMTIRRGAEISGVRAYSSGPNKVFDTYGTPEDDDVRSL